jgi:hypothetical protein
MWIIEISIPIKDSVTDILNLGDALSETFRRRHLPITLFGFYILEIIVSDKDSVDTTLSEIRDLIASKGFLIGENEVEIDINEE